VVPRSGQALKQNRFGIIADGIGVLERFVLKENGA
jgi:hypothetical protein